MNNEPNFENPTPQEVNEAPKTKRCPVCGKEADAQASFCGECGCSFAAGTTPAPAVQPAVQEDTSPLKTSDYFLMFLLTSLPFIGFVLMLIWAFSSGINVNRRNFSRAYLILSLILGAITSLLCFAIIGLGMSLAYSEVYAAILPFIFR